MNPPSCTAFEGKRCIASGELRDVALKVKAEVTRNEWASVLIFNDATGHQIEVDLRGTAKEVAKRLNDHPLVQSEAAIDTSESLPRSVGRPKLGVVAREVTLLPRHWEWLGQQPGGASVALRKLVETARHANAAKDRQRQAQEAAYRFMSAIAGNEPAFEEATRALFSNDAKRFATHTSSWSPDLRNHTRKLATVAFDAATEAVVKASADH
jgi:hypothetical protein